MSHLFFADDSIIFVRTKVRECIVVRRILKICEEASRQKNNLEKSAITFSPNITNGDHGRIHNMFMSLVNALPHLVYLCLPSLVGRNKKKVFANIKE